MVYISTWIEHLSDEDITFIKRFILNSGSLKSLSKEYNVSYPTMRLRMDRLIQKIEVIEEDSNTFKSKLMQMVIDNEIDLNIANKIVEIYLKEEGSKYEH
ncbi:DUF2089 family protein [Staphylococcus coagulans]|uniref:DUF2089 family protein n=2 Tax=Staphylococcus coagulans TaxID=74706 RepID=UPI0030EBCB1F